MTNRITPDPVATPAERSYWLGWLAGSLGTHYKDLDPALVNDPNYRLGVNDGWQELAAEHAANNPGSFTIIIIG